MFHEKHKERNILRIARTKDEESTTHAVVLGHVGIPPEPVARLFKTP